MYEPRAGAVASYALGTVLLFFMAVLPSWDDEAKSSPARATNLRDEIQSDVTAQPTPARHRATAEPIEDSPPAPFDDEPEQPENLKGVAEQLERRFATDGAPTDTMVEAQNTFASFFSKQAVAGTELLDVKCRTSVCRAEVAFTKPFSDRDFFRYAFLDPETRMDFGLDVSVPVRTTGDDGKVTATVYLFKAEPVLAQAEGDDALKVESWPAAP